VQSADGAAVFNLTPAICHTHGHRRISTGRTRTPPADKRG
jgi:hypothetical protein